MKRFLAITIITILFLGTFQETVFAKNLFSICDKDYASETKKTYNEALEKFISDKFQYFILANAQIKETVPEENSSQCSLKRSDEWKEWKALQYNNYFGISNFIFSFSYLSGNTCKIKDIEKLRMQLEFFEKEINSYKQKCIDPSSINELTEIYGETSALMKFIRNTDNQNEADENEALKKYWYDDLYKKKSKICRTDSWEEVRRSWCDLSENLQNLKENFSDTGKSVNPFSNDPKIKKQRELMAKQRAWTYIATSIQIPFLRIKPMQSTGTNAEETLNRNNFFNNLFDPILTLTGDINSEKYPSNDIQEILNTQEESFKEAIKLFEAQEMLKELSNKYGKTYAVQVSLESEINKLTDHIKDLYKKNSKDLRNLYGFVETLKKTEIKSPNSCSVDISLNK